jgi:hypothetical protein
VCAKVIRNGQVAGNIDMNGGPPVDDIGSEFGFQDKYAGFGGFGPFVVGTLSGVDGVSTFTFRLPAAVSGDTIQLAVEMAGHPVDPGSFDPHAPMFDRTSLFDIANTPAAFRASPVITLP